LYSGLRPIIKITDLNKSVNRSALSGALLLCSIVLTIIAWHVSHSHLKEKTRDRFEYRMSDIQAEIQVRMSAYEQVLRSAVGFFDASGSVERSEWNKYVQSLRLQELYPGIQA
jgi:CHASE1-domain containing sensor protein